MSQLFVALEKVAGLPECVDKKPAIRAILDKWREKNLVLVEVIAGHCSFESLVSPIVIENLKVRFPYFWSNSCCSQDFQEMVKGLEKKLEGIVDFDTWITMGRCPCHIHLGDPVKFPRSQFGAMLAIPVSIGISCWFMIPEVHLHSLKAILLSLGIGIIFASFQVFASAASYYSDRRRLARNIMEIARKLDKAVKDCS